MLLVKFKLYKGNIIKAGTTSPYSLYSESLASFTTGELYDHHDADGFITLFGLPLKVRAMKMLELEKNKDITFSFRQGITSDLIKGLKDSKYDVVFCSYVENEEDIVFDLLFKDELILIVPIAHPLSKVESIDLKDIASYPVVVYDKNTALGKITKDIFKKVGINPKVICEGEDENGIYGLVSEGFGVAVVADIVNYDNFNIKKIKINNSGCDRCIYMAYKKNTYQVPAVKKFIKYINDTSKDIFINDK